MVSYETLKYLFKNFIKADTDNVKVTSEPAYDSTNDWKKVSVENDSVGLAKSADVSNVSNLLTSTNDILSNNLTPPTTGGTAQITVGKTPTALGGNTPIKSVIIRADSSNTDKIWLGFDNTVDDTKGFPLAHDEYIEIVIDNLSKIYVMSPTDGQKVYIMWVGTNVNTGSQQSSGGGG